MEIINEGKDITILENNIIYKGAGVLIIMKNDNNEDCVILFREYREHKKISDCFLDLPGGRCDSIHKNLEETAAAELYEESRKTIYISPEILKKLAFITIQGRKDGLQGYFKCFICRIDMISEIIYNYNRLIFDYIVDLKNPAINGNLQKQKDMKYNLKSYLETMELCKIPVRNIEKICNTNNRKCFDDKNNLVIISGQSLRVYYQATIKKILIRKDNKIINNKLLIKLDTGMIQPNKNLYYKDEKIQLEGKTIYIK